MPTLSISTADAALLNELRFGNQYNATVQKRLHAVYLRVVLNKKMKKVCAYCDCGRNAISRAVRCYAEHGIEGITETKYGTNVSELDAHKDKILEHLRKEPAYTLAEIRQRIIDLTGITRGLSQVRIWVRKQGIGYYKTGQIPAKADTEQQALFITETLEPAIKQAENGEIHLLFMDAAHFVMGVFQCFLWAFTRVFIRSSAGRKRLNVLGAVNAITKQTHFLTNTTYINALTIVEFLYQLRTDYPTKPIYIVLDNARYQHCELVKNIAQSMNIHLLFLPPYSPNLNIIERLWKWTKKRCLYAKYYQTFDQFCDAIQHTLTLANTTYRHELLPLLTLNFQQF